MGWAPQGRVSLRADGYLPVPYGSTGDDVQAAGAVVRLLHPGRSAESAGSIEQGDVTATYILDGDEFIVVNRCRNENGE